MTVDVPDRQADDALLGLHSAAIALNFASASFDKAAALKVLERVLSGLSATQSLLAPDSVASLQAESFVAHIDETRSAASRRNFPAETWHVLLQDIIHRLTRVADVVLQFINREGLAIDVSIEYSLSGALPGMAISHVDVGRRFRQMLRDEQFRLHFGYPNVRLENGSQLTAVSDCDTDFWWDRYWTRGDPNDPGHGDDEVTVCVLGRGDDVVWQEVADDSFELRALAALRQRFGDRVETLPRERYAGPRRGGFPFD